jgi:glucose-specific phosphotransferase system IIA component
MVFTRKQKSLLAVCDGACAPVSEIPDEAFALGLLGKGFAQDPENGIFRSPVDGRVENVSKTKHAYSIYTKDGLDILVHIGVDTVELNGDGFSPAVAEGQNLKAGDIIAKVDLDLIKERGFNPITAVLVTNPDKIMNVAYKFGNAKAGTDAVMYYGISK